MALKNIIPPSRQITNGAGQVLAGGKVFLFEPGTTTFVTSYQDSGLQVPNVNPVRLTGSGRANIWISRDVDMFITDRTSGDVVPSNIIVTELNANPDALGTDEAGGLVPNGSFEIDTDADGVPDGWTLVSESGSNNDLDTSKSTDGGQSFRFTSNGSGGGSLTTTDFFPVNDTEQLRVNVDLESSVSNVQNIIRVEWYDVSQVFISNSDPYDSTANPTSFTSQNLVVAPPAGARFAKLRLIGCDPATAVAGSTWFDRVSVFYPAVVTGVFDNITIQDNEIISTNTNGVIDLVPDGTGRVRHKNNTTFFDGVSTQLGVVGYDGGVVNMELHNEVDGGLVSLIADDSGAVSRNLVVGDPDADTRLYYAGDIKLNTNSTGVNVRGSFTNDPAAGGNQDTKLLLRNADNLLAGELGYTANNTNLGLLNRTHGGNVFLTSEDSGGVSRTTFQGNPDGSATLYYNGVSALTTGADGIDVRDTSGATTRIGYLNDAGTRLAFMTATSTDFIWRNEVHGGRITLQGEDTGGSVRTLLDTNPDAATELFYAGGRRYATGGDGNVNYKSDSSDVGNNLLYYVHANGTVRGLIGHIDTELDVRNSINGGRTTISCTTTAGSFKRAITIFPDSYTEIRHTPTGDVSSRTTTPGAGGLRVNNTLTGSGVERVLTESDIGASGPTRVIKSSNTIRASTTTQSADPELTISITETGLYLVEVYVLTQNTGTAAADIKLGLDWSGSVNDNRGYLAFGLDPTGTDIIREGQFSSTPSALAFKSEFSSIDANLIRITGCFDANSTGTLALHWAQNTSDANGTSVLRHSFMEVTKITSI